jgi:hypothetical protein
MDDYAKKTRHEDERYKTLHCHVYGNSRASVNLSLAEDVLASHGRVIDSVVDG